MSCPVCSRTMQNLGTPERRVFWCSGCGTLKEESGDFSQVELPYDLRHVITAANLGDGRFGGTTSTTVRAEYHVRREGTNQPTVELVIYDSMGRRAF